MFTYFKSLLDKRRKNKEKIEHMTHIFDQASAGDCAALYELGMLYENGLGVEQNLERASECYLKAANNGMLEACRKLGKWCDEGFNGKRDVSQAIHWFRICAQSNNLDDSYKFSMLCAEYDGELSTNDIEIALETLEPLSESKDPNAMYGFALMCEKGLSELDENKIHDLMKLAAFKGQIKAQMWMGNKFASNDIKEALCWYDIAAKNGCSDASIKINQLRESS